MRIFIAGPYGDSDPEDVIAANVRRADRVARALLAAGHEVYVPHKMTWGWQKDARLSREDFKRLDDTFLFHWATAFIRIPGYSPGACAEETMARRLPIPVLEDGESIDLVRVFNEGQDVC